MVNGNQRVNLLAWEAVTEEKHSCATTEYLKCLIKAVIFSRSFLSLSAFHDLLFLAALASVGILRHHLISLVSLAWSLLRQSVSEGRILLLI